MADWKEVDERLGGYVEDGCEGNSLSETHIVNKVFRKRSCDTRLRKYTIAISLFLYKKDIENFDKS